MRRRARAYDARVLLALTVSHAELPLGQLADLSRGLDGLSDELARRNEAHPQGPLLGWALLATCNRIELYVDAARFHDGLEVVTAALEARTGWTRPQLTTTFQVRSGAPVAEHLFSVAAGLESLVLGEAEITGQVRAGFHEALRAQTSTPLLNDLFQQALRTAKRVATSTALGRAGRSSAQVVLDTAAAHLGRPVSSARVLVIGSGAYARVVCAELAVRRTAEVGVWSPSGRRSASVDRYGFAHVTPTRLPGWLRAADVVIACSGQGTPVLRAEQVAERMDGPRPLVVLDMSLQPDVEAGVGELEGVTLLGLNSLAGGLERVGATALAEARAVIAEGVERFEARQRVRAADPVIVSMRAYVRDLVADEVAGLRERLPAETVAEVERSLHRVYRKMMHAPTLTAQRHAEAGTTDDYLRALHTVMGIDMANAAPRPLIDAEALPLAAVHPDALAADVPDRPLTSPEEAR